MRVKGQGEPEHGPSKERKSPESHSGTRGAMVRGESREEKIPERSRIMICECSFQASLIGCKAGRRVDGGQAQGRR